MTIFRLNTPRLLRFEKTPRNFWLIAAAAMISLLAILCYIYSRTTSGMPTLGPYYYSIDRGKTFYSSNRIRIPLFKRGGKNAVGAVVYVNARGNPFVSYVYTYGTTGHDLLLGMPKVNGQLINNLAMRQQAAKDCFVSKPGGKKWVPWNSPAGQKIVNVRDPATGKPFKPYHGG